MFARLVRDQNEALDFFVNKLGFEKKDDSMMGEGKRWLTIGLRSQPELEIILQSPDWGMDNLAPAEREAQIGKSSGLSFASDDIEDDYRKLMAKGIEVLAPPAKKPWGRQILFKDPYGNIHLLVEYC